MTLMLNDAEGMEYSYFTACGILNKDLSPPQIKIGESAIGDSLNIITFFDMKPLLRKSSFCTDIFDQNIHIVFELN